jgi:hypothetical protein
MIDQPDYAHPLTEPRNLLKPEALVHDLETLVHRIAEAFLSKDGAELVAISDEFMSYADDLANHGHALGAPRPSAYLCAACHRNPVAAEDGYDTCADCLSRV